VHIIPNERYSSSENIIGYEAGTISPGEDIVVEWQVSDDDIVWISLNLGKYHLIQSVASAIPLQVMAYNYFRIIAAEVSRYREITITRSNEIESGIPAPSSTGQVLGASGTGLNWSNTPDTAGMHFSWNGTAAKWVKNNYSATANPAVGDDNLDGYDVGSIWINTVTGQTFWCTNSSTGSAVWQPGGALLSPVGITIDGGGSVITTGVKGYYRCPYAGTIKSVTLLADQPGDCVIDIWKDIYANAPPTNADSITASALPTLSGAQKSEDITLTGWDTQINAGDVLAYNVVSAVTITRVTLQLEIQRS
jgi:hypothetical protein